MADDKPRAHPEFVHELEITCEKHAIVTPWEGHVVCTECGRLYWLPFRGVSDTAEIREPQNLPYCDCLELLVETNEHGQFVLNRRCTGQAICPECYREHKPRIQGYEDTAPEGQDTN